MNLRLLTLTLGLSLLCSALPAAAGEMTVPASRNNPGAAGANIGDEEVQGKDPLVATIFAVMPGMVFHGFGNYYAGDYDFGTRMLVAEIFGAGLAIWGHNIIHQPQNWGPYFGGEVPQAGYWIKAAGVALITLSWIGDLATASEAAESYNKDHSYQFQLDSFNDTGARIMLSSKF